MYSISFLWGGNRILDQRDICSSILSQHHLFVDCLSYSLNFKFCEWHFQPFQGNINESEYWSHLELLMNRIKHWLSVNTISCWLNNQGIGKVFSLIPDQRLQKEFRYCCSWGGGGVSLMEAIVAMLVCQYNKWYHIDKYRYHAWQQIWCNRSTHLHIKPQTN